MNREPNGASMRQRQRHTQPASAGNSYLPKERCAIWLPDSKAYLQGVTPHGLYTVPDLSRALVVDGDRATDLAEQVMTFHRVRVVVRTYGQGIQ